MSMDPCPLVGTVDVAFVLPSIVVILSLFEFRT